MHKYRLFLTACLLASSALHAAPALAQDNAAPVAEAGNAIIVTAQKFEQRAQDVPITISALSGDRIRDLGVGDLDELSYFIPGLNIQEQSANNPGVVIRGVTSDSGSAQQGPRVTLYYNGVDISRSRGSYQAIYDMERIEVIKGPQATLFGTAAAVGAISLVPNRPRPGFSAQITGGYGNYDYTLLSGFLNAGSEVIAGRVAFEWKRRDGYVENLNPAQEEELYALDNLGLRASLRIMPTDRLVIDLVGTYDRQRNGGTPFISGTFPTTLGPANPFGPANLGGSPLSAQVLGAPQLGLTRDIYDGNLTISFDISDHWSFTTVNGYREFDSLEIFDADGSPAWYLEFAELAQGWQASHEGRFAYQSDRLRASFGWNYFTEDGIQNVPFSADEGAFITCLTGGALGAPCIAPNGTNTSAQVIPALTGGALTALPYASLFENQGQNDTFSVFADATFLPTDWLELTAGLRYLWEERQSGYRANVPVPALPGLLPASLRAQLLGALPSLAVSLIPGQVDTAGQIYYAAGEYWDLLPRFNVLVRATDDLNFYATIAKGRRSPVVQLSARRVNGRAERLVQRVPEEIVWNYEAGLKYASSFVSASLGVYRLDYSGFQVSVVQPDGTSRTESAGSATNTGVEAELALNLASWLTLFANGAYIDARIDENNAFAPAFAGARFRLQPKWQGAAGFTIDAPMGNGMRLFATPSLTHRSRLFFELPNNPRLAQGPVTLLNARAGIAFANDRFEIAGFIRNATDEDFLLDAGNTGGAFGIATFIPGEPRFYGVELTARLF